MKTGELPIADAAFQARHGRLSAIYAVVLAVMIAGVMIAASALLWRIIS